MTLKHEDFMNHNLPNHNSKLCLNLQDLGRLFLYDKCPTKEKKHIQVVAERNPKYASECTSLLLLLEI